MKTAAIIPAKGRVPLLMWTIDRLKDINKVDHVIIVGHEPEIKDVAMVMECDWLYHPNFPLGMKMNEGWEYAWKKYNPDAFVYVGSSEWLTDGWVTEMIPNIGKYDMIGNGEKHFLNVGLNHRRFCRLRTPDKNPIGTGSIVSRRIVEAMNGRPFHDHIDNELDWSLIENIRSYGGKVLKIKSESKSLSISYHKWPNQYDFVNYWNNGILCDQMGDGNDFLKEFFKDSMDFTLW